jgi:hypothetical protein
LYIPKSGSSVWAAITNGFRLNDGTNDLCDITHSATKTYIKGSDASADDIYIYPNRADAYPYFYLMGGGSIEYVTHTNGVHNFKHATTIIGAFAAAGGYPEIRLKETSSSPTNISGYGQIYTKSDNNLYFKDGDGNEYTIDKT